MFSEYPYVNKDDLNLDYILKRVKDSITAIAGFEAWKETVDDDITVLTDFVNDLKSGILPEEVTEAVYTWLSEHVDFTSLWVTPQEFGAVADGVTDDGGAINAAITASRFVYIPAGNYKIETPVNLESNTVIICDGVLLADVLYTGLNNGNAAHAYKNVLIGSNLSNVYVKGLTIQGAYEGGSILTWSNTDTGFNVGQPVLNIQRGDNVHFDNVTFEKLESVTAGINDYNQYPLDNLCLNFGKITNVSRLKLTNCRIIDSSGEGIACFFCDDMLVDNLYCDTLCVSVFDTVYCDGVTIKNSEFVGTYSGDTVNINCKDAIIDNCKITGFLDVSNEYGNRNMSGYASYNLGTAIVRNCVFTDGGVTNHSDTTYGLSTIEKLVIENNKFTWTINDTLITVNTWRTYIEIGKGSTTGCVVTNAVINDNDFKLTGYATSYTRKQQIIVYHTVDLTIENNNFYDGVEANTAPHGIIFINSAVAFNSLTVKNNVFYGHRWLVCNSTSIDKVMIIGNDIYSNWGCAFNTSKIGEYYILNNTYKFYNDSADVTQNAYGTVASLLSFYSTSATADVRCRKIVIADNDVTGLLIACIRGTGGESLALRLIDEVVIKNNLLNNFDSSITNATRWYLDIHTITISKYVETGNVALDGVITNRRWGICQSYVNGNTYESTAANVFAGSSVGASGTQLRVCNNDYGSTAPQVTAGTGQTTYVYNNGTLT